ncbi:conserved hypothetical protein [uncultured Defluviicoccus sp.]|uniref:Uncharacterized protein n=1 Tax=metagenome TaxID=256318 RepID=A0A380TLB5_9ZZZZ|nr:conserved hypothetical protein [uncultured Defluviicoccus sp.]
MLSHVTSRTAVAACDEALSFIKWIESLGLRPPVMGIADDGEFVLEFIADQRRAVVSIDGTGALGYALLQQGCFVPGAESARTHAVDLPTDLADYLYAM